jgi:AbrB family looped-hinge helix DNA binding protein
MNVKLSSKGQLVIPKKIRKALNLQPGTEFDVELINGKILLHPIVDKENLEQIIKELQELAKGSNLLDALAEERRWELEKEHRREQSLFTG